MTARWSTLAPANVPKTFHFGTLDRTVLSQASPTRTRVVWVLLVRPGQTSARKPTARNGVGLSVQTDLMTQRNSGRLDPRLINAVAGMWSGGSSPTHNSIDSILTKNGIDSRQYVGPGKQEKVRRSLEEEGPQTAVQLIRDYVERLKVEGFFDIDDELTMHNLKELRSAFEAAGGELDNAGKLSWEPTHLRSDSIVDITKEGQTWSYDQDEEEIGKGGYGIVYKGWDEEEKSVAIKKIPLAQANDETDRKQLHREFDAARGIREKNPGSVQNVLIPIAEVKEFDSFFIIMPYAEGGSLKKRLKEVDRFSIPDTLDILEQIANGLHEISNMGFLHRDVKTDNILRHEDKWKLADFGISRFVENDTASYTLMWKGTTGYTAPETIRGEHKTIQSDLYSVGVIAYELLTGSKPFIGNKEEIAKQTLEALPPELSEDIPSQVQIMVFRLLKKIPAERYADPGALIDAIHRARQASGKPASKLSQALSVRERKSEETQIQHALQLQDERKAHDRITQAMSDLEEIVHTVVDEARNDDPSTSARLEKSRWDITMQQNTGVAIATWDGIAQDAAAPGLRELICAGAVFLLPEPEPPTSAYVMNGPIREGRVPDANLVCVMDKPSGNPRWLLFIVNGPQRAHGLDKSSFLKHWALANRPGMKIFDYTSNEDPLTSDALIDLLVHAIDGRYVEARRIY